MLADTTDATQKATFQTGHIGLNVSDIERSKRFYQAVFGFELMGESTSENRVYAFLGDSERLVLTLWQQSEGRFVPTTPGLHHLSFQVADMTTVRDAEERIRELGAYIHHGGIVSHSEGAQSGGVFFDDPDGIRLEIYAPKGADENAAPHADAPTCGFF